MSDHSGYPWWADTVGKQTAVRLYWLHKITAAQLSAVGTKLDDIYGLPTIATDGKFWHVSPNAGQLPKWVTRHIDDGAMYTWKHWQDHSTDPDVLLELLIQYGWITSEYDIC